MYLWLIALILLFVSGILLFIYGVRRNSGIRLLIGGILVLTPLFIAADLNLFVPLVPPLALAIVFLTKKMLKPA